MRKIPTILLFLCITAVVYSQNNTTYQKSESIGKARLVFTESKILDDQYKVVYFCIDNLKDENKKSEILAVFEKKDFIKKARIYKDLFGYDRCQLNLKIDVTAEDIQDILIENDMNFTFFSVKEAEKQ